MDERRERERTRTGVFFGVYERTNSKYVGRLVDLSVKGLLLLAKVKVSLNEVYKLKMDLPEPINEKSQIYFDARCKWCEQSKKTKLFSAGLEFENITPETTKQIEELVGHELFSDDSGDIPLSVMFQAEE